MPGVAETAVASGQWPVAGNFNVKGNGLIHESARISTKNVNCGLCQGGVAGGGGSPRTREGRNCRGQGAGVRGQELQGAVHAGRTRERLATHTHGRLGTRRIGDTLESRTYGGGATGRRLSRAALEPTSGGVWRGVRGALRGESPRTREGRRPDRPKGNRRAHSCTLPEHGAWTGQDMVATRGMGISTPISDCARSVLWLCNRGP